MLFACCSMSPRVALGRHNSYIGSCQRQHDDERRPVAFAPTARLDGAAVQLDQAAGDGEPEPEAGLPLRRPGGVRLAEGVEDVGKEVGADRSEEHTSELQSPCNLVCRLLLEKKKKKKKYITSINIIIITKNNSD